MIDLQDEETLTITLKRRETLIIGCVKEYPGFMMFDREISAVMSDILPKLEKYLEDVRLLKEASDDGKR